MTVGFIAAVAAVGVFVGTRPTVIDGRVMATELLPALRQKNPQLERMDCQPAIEVGVGGAEFRCTHTFEDGSSLDLEYLMDREGSVQYRTPAAEP